MVTHLVETHQSGESANWERAWRVKNTSLSWLFAG